MRVYQREKSAIWWVSYTDTDGAQRRCSTRCTVRSAAEIVGRRLERDAQDPSGANAAAHTLDSALGALLDDRAEAGKASGTQSMYRQKAAQLVRVLGNDTPLASIDADAVDAYKKRRKAEGMAPATIQKELVTLRMAMKLAKRRDLFRGEPSVIVRPVAEASRAVERVIDEADVPALLARLPRELAGLVAYCLATGARLGEAARAAHGDVAADLSQVTLYGTKTAASRRTIPVPRHCVPLLSLAVVGTLARAPLGAQPFARAAVLVHKPLRAAGIAACGKPLSPNDLRRSYATWLFRRGVAPHVIARLLGHTTTAMVDRVYARSSAGDLASLLGEHGPGRTQGVPLVYTGEFHRGKTSGDNDH